MKNLWNDKDAKTYSSELGLRVYTSRLLGQDPTLVLHGGGNTSVKVEETNIFGDKENILYVKGSGWDLISIEEAGFAPVKLDYVAKLAELPSLSDPQMVNELKTQMKNSSAPSPSVETILHAILPYKYVDHTHANAVLTITNSCKGEAAIKEIYGDSVVIVPYTMPGFDLAGICKKCYDEQVNSKTIGMILLNHGVFSFADDAKTSYDRMIKLVSQAKDYLKQNNAWELQHKKNNIQQNKMLNISSLRKNISKISKCPMILKTNISERVMSFIYRKDLPSISQQGPATPDHVLRTKRLPMLDTQLAEYTKSYEEYFQEHKKTAKTEVKMLDAAPRIILDKEVGLISIGNNIKAAKIVEDIYGHTMDIIERAETLGGYRALNAKDIFDVEYWDLEQAKLNKGGQTPLFSGEIALVTGGGSGIGKACVESFLARGSTVVALDISDNIQELFDNPAYLGIQCDISNINEVKNALSNCVYQFGGLDMLVLNAGIFPGGCKISDIQSDEWNQVLDINLTANLNLLRESYPLLQQAPNGGRVVAIGSKNVPAPGPGAVAYSASKAALTQMMRIAALEWGADKIRLNTVHPDAVFDTAIWTDEVLLARANHYGLTVEEYKTKNILKKEITSHDVAELVVEMCGPLFSCTTAAQVPIDGGNDRVI